MSPDTSVQDWEDCEDCLALTDSRDDGQIALCPNHAIDADVQPMASQEAEARLFHEAYERLAPSFGYESAVPWEDLPEDNKRLMAAVCSEVGAAIRASERAKVEAYEELERTVRDLLAGHGGGSWAVEAALNRIDAVRAGRAS